MKTKKIFYHIGSLLILIFLILFLPKIIFAQGEIIVPDTGLPSPPGGIKAILSNVLTWMLGIIGMIAIISFVISGLQYFYAAGDEKNMETAKRNLTYSIIGVIVALSGLVIVKAIDAALRGSGAI
jgi:hypothetical protein